MSKANKTYSGESYAIVLDASFDLYQAGHPNDDDAQGAFFAAYEEAAEKIAEESGIEIAIISGNYEGPAMLKQTSNGDEGDLWQDIHDRLRLIDGSWVVL